MGIFSFLMPNRKNDLPEESVRLELDLIEDMYYDQGGVIDSHSLLKDYEFRNLGSACFEFAQPLLEAMLPPPEPEPDYFAEDFEPRPGARWLETKPLENVLERLERKDDHTFQDYGQLFAISNFASFVQDVQGDRAKGNDFWEIIDLRCEDILSKVNWRKHLELHSNELDSDNFLILAEIAESKGIDTWAYRFERQKRGIDIQWFYLARDTKSDRVEKLIELAMRQFPLKQLAVGAEDNLGLGEEYRVYLYFEAVVDALIHTPGKGAELLNAALRSPPTRLRRKAVAVLRMWGVGHWPDGTKELLMEMKTCDPSQEVGEDARELLEQVEYLLENR